MQNKAETMIVTRVSRHRGRCKQSRLPSGYNPLPNALDIGKANYANAKRESQ